MSEVETASADELVVSIALNTVSMGDGDVGLARADDGGVLSRTEAWTGCWGVVCSEAADGSVAG